MSQALNRKVFSRVATFVPWWLWLLAINLSLVVATVAHHKMVLTHTIHFFLRQIDLAIEMNFAAWWSGVLLLLLSLLAYEIYCDRHEKLRSPWLFLAIAWLCLSLDEIGSIHERIEDWTPERWLPYVDPYVPIALIGLLLIPYPLIKLSRQWQTQRSALWLTFGFLLLASIAVQERLEGVISWGDWWGLRIGVEEGTELLGMLCCYCGLVNHTWRGQRPKALSGILPNPLKMKRLPRLILVGLVMHLSVVAVLVVTLESPFSEHTLVWYPLVLAVVIGLSAFWRYRRLPDRLNRGLNAWLNSKSWLLLMLYALIYSAVLCYVVPLKTNKADAFLSDELYAFYGMQLGAITLLFLLIPSQFSKKLFAKSPSAPSYSILALLALVVLLCGLAPTSMTVRYALPGVFTFLTFQLFFASAFIPASRHPTLKED